MKFLIDDKCRNCKDGHWEEFAGKIKMYCTKYQKVVGDTCDLWIDDEGERIKERGW